jgi:hypothetical protein
MGQTSSMPTLNPFKAFREMREAGMESWARIAVRVTSSTSYSLVSSVLARPGLIVAGIARRKTDKAMAQLLGYANMPSRDDVLSLSVRLTHIEIALDDLAAAMEAMRAKAPKPSPVAKRASTNDRTPQRPTTPPEG